MIWNGGTSSWTWITWCRPTWSRRGSDSGCEVRSRAHAGRSSRRPVWLCRRRFNRSNRRLPAGILRLVPRRLCDCATHGSVRRCYCILSKTSLTSEIADWKGNSLTAPGFLVGTPNYVAPEVVMGRPFDGRVDQYSLAMSVYEILTGNNCMEGPTPSATVVNQTMIVPPPLTDILPDLSKRTSDAILRGLAKNPADRFETCSVLAQEVLAEVPSGSSRTAVALLNGLTSRGEAGRVPCPSCGTPIPAGREHAGRRLRCTKCQAVSYVQILSRNTLQLKLLEHPPVSVGAGSPIVIDAPDDEIDPDPSAVTLQVQKPGSSSTLLPMQAGMD